MTAGRVPMAELLAHHEWVSRLAHHMAGEAGDDVIQDAWVAALRSPPDGGRPPRPWLAQVVRNLVRLRWRDARRREQREATFVAEAPAAEGVEHVYERMDLQRALAEHVMALEEPLRTVVVLRYVEGLDATAIAAATGSPAGTVRWRLKVAVDRLRAGMDERPGGRRAWVVVLAAPRGRFGPVTKGALLMANTKLKVSLLALVALLFLGLGGVAVWRARSRPVVVENAAAPRHPGVHLTAPPARAGSIAGVVEDEAGQPLAGAFVAASAPGVGPVPPTRTRADGTFEVSALRAGRYVVTAMKSGVARSKPLEVASQAVRGLVLKIGRASAGLSGRVIDSGGGGIPGARILAVLRTGDAPVPFAVIADDQGRYALSLIPGEYGFQAEADGYAPVRFTMYLHAPFVREFRLHPASRISGRVTDGPGGATLAGAEVWALNPGVRSSRTLAADDGSFTFSDLEPGNYLLAGRAGPFVGRRSAPVALGLAQTVSDVELVLARGRTVTGTVRDMRGEAVADAEVLATNEPPSTARTDARGAFEIAGLAPARYQLRARSAGGTAGARVDVTGADARAVRLVLAPDAVVTGVVLDEQRRGVKEARVVIVTDPSPRAGNTTVFTDEAGHFRAEGLTPGPLSVSASHERGLAEITAGALEAGVPKQVELVLAEGASVEGVVRGEDGRPAAGAQVFALGGLTGYAQNRWPQPTAAAASAPDGTYRLARLPAGDVVVRAVNAGDDPFTGLLGRVARRDSTPVALRPRERKTGVDLVLLRNDLKVRGRVLDEDGRPVAGVALEALADGVGRAGAQTRTLSQQDGQFVIDGLTAGPYTIIAVHAGYADARRDRIAAGSTGVELRMSRPGALAGVLVDASGAPVPEYTIAGRPVLGTAATEEELRLAWSRPQLTARVSQPDGGFSFPIVVPGTYELNAYLPDKRSAVLASVTVGSEHKPVRLVAQPSAAIRGRVIDYRTGRPVPSARAEGRGTAMGQLTATADASGIFVLEGLPAGRLVDFAVIPPRNDYITDCQHRVMPAKGGTVDIGDVPVFPGSNQTLGMRGAVMTGLWFQSQEGHPAIYSVVPASPGAQAGARPGDLVVAVDDTEVRDQSSSVVEGLVASAGPVIKLTVESSGVARTLTVSHR